jgi:hypothetical protein
MGLYGGVKEAKYSEGGVYIDPGVFRFEIQAVKTIKTRAGKAGFVAELKVLEASGDTKLKPGNTCSWMTMEGETFLGNVKHFASVAAACWGGTSDVDEDSVTEEAILAITDEKANPFKGINIRASAVNITTKKGTPFTKVRWLPDNTGAAAVAAV